MTGGEVSVGIAWRCLLLVVMGGQHGGFSGLHVMRIERVGFWSISIAVWTRSHCFMLRETMRLMAVTMDYVVTLSNGVVCKECGGLGSSRLRTRLQAFQHINLRSEAI